ncbi:MAG: hypothetical protein IT559_08710 [Alphaproteobacteria bacterium]|nr:hypothetical protein [Alphaproteobacteria bacterium]
MAFGPSVKDMDLSKKGTLRYHWGQDTLFADMEERIDLAAETKEAPVSDSAVYDLADKAGHNLRNEFAMALRSGNLGESQVSVQTCGAESATLHATAEDKKRKQSEESMRFARLIHALNERMRVLEKEMADLAVKLRAKYGDDFIGGMAAAHLSEAELAEARTEEDQLKRLTDKLLETGIDGKLKIKAGFENSEDAQWLIRQMEKETIKPIIEEYNGKNYLTADEQKDFESKISTLESFDILHSINKVDNIEAKELLSNRHEQNDHVHNNIAGLGSMNGL